MGSWTETHRGLSLRTMETYGCWGVMTTRRESDVMRSTSRYSPNRRSRQGPDLSEPEHKHLCQLHPGIHPFASIR